MGRLLAWTGVVLAVAGVCGCRAAQEVVPGELRPELAGEYQAAGGSGPFLLVLEEDGTYQCLVLLYISGFECADVIGNGSSHGEWFTVGDKVRFEVRSESDDMELSLVDAIALIGEDRLELEVEGRSYPLVRMR